MTEHRCRLCTANDLDAVIERVAAAMWESRRYGTLHDRPWDAAGEYWQPKYREPATAALEGLRS